MALVIILVFVILIEQRPCIYNHLMEKENLYVSYMIFACVPLVISCTC